MMYDKFKHYVASDKPVGQTLRDDKRSVLCEEVSAGHPKHEYTTGYAFDEIIKFFGFTH